MTRMYYKPKTVINFVQLSFPNTSPKKGLSKVPHTY